MILPFSNSIPTDYWLNCRSTDIIFLFKYKKMTCSKHSKECDKKYVELVIVVKNYPQFTYKWQHVIVWDRHKIITSYRHAASYSNNVFDCTMSARTSVLILHFLLHLNTSLVTFIILTYWYYVDNDFSIEIY